jgi:hypothetical protein
VNHFFSSLQGKYSQSDHRRKWHQRLLERLDVEDGGYDEPTEDNGIGQSRRTYCFFREIAPVTYRRCGSQTHITSFIREKTTKA